MKDQAIELDSESSRDWSRGGADEHSSWRDILSKGTEAHRHRGLLGRGKAGLTDVCCAEETGVEEQELGPEAEGQALRSG